MLLKQTEKENCLRDVSQNLPRLLQTCSINLSCASERQLAEIVRKDICFKYFPSNGQTIASGLLTVVMPIPFIFMHAMGFHIVIPKDCSNPELQNIDRHKLDSLEKVIETILIEYRDYAKEEELDRESAARRSAREASELRQRRVGNVATTSSYDHDRSLADARSRLAALEERDPICPPNCIMM